VSGAPRFVVPDDYSTDDDSDEEEIEDAARKKARISENTNPNQHPVPVEPLVTPL
jgi:hypothetical protein